MVTTEIKSVFQFTVSNGLKIVVSFFLLGSLFLTDTGAQQEALTKIKSLKIKGEYAPGEILIKFKRGVKEKRMEGVYQALGASIRKRIRRLDVHLVKIPAHRDVLEMSESFRKNPLVEYAEPNYRRYRTITEPNDTYFSDQWALSQIDDHDIDAPEGWDEQTGSSSIIIAV